MRETIHERTGVRKGDVVCVRCWLKDRRDMANISIYAREGEGDFAPFVPELDVKPIPAEPIMYRPMHLSLGAYRREGVFKFRAYCDMDIRVIAEKDRKTDVVNLDVRSNVQGKVIQTIRWFFGNPGRLVRRLYAAIKPRG
jgi:hypothetical protein